MIQQIWETHITIQYIHTIHLPVFMCINVLTLDTGNQAGFVIQKIREIDYHNG